MRLLIAATVAFASSSVTGQPVPPDGGYQAPGGAAVGQTATARRGVGSWVTETSLRAETTLTNNANYGSSGAREGDLILEVVPSWRFNRQGGRLRVDGSVSLDMFAYANGTQVNSILPAANVFANLEAVDNLFYVDASLSVSQFVENPYLPTSRTASTNNLYTSSQVRLAPFLTGAVGPYVSWLIRSDNTYSWTSRSDAPLDNAYYARNLAEVVRAPTPFGVTLRLTNDITRIQNQLQPDQTLYTALAIFDYAVTPQFKFGLRGGYENTNYTAENYSGPIYGFNLAWRPSPLTSLDGYWEDRFYGASYQYRFSHRQRRVASSFGGYRTISTYPQVLFQIPSTSSVSGLMDAILVARFPDPVERAKEVQDLITRQGLPESLPQGAYVYNQSANILTGFNATLALTGIRNTLALNLFYLKTEYLPDARVPPSFLVFNNSIQRGAGLSLSHLLTPVVTLNGTVTTRYTTGFDQNAGLSGREGWASLQANWRASPRTTLFFGARYQRTSDTSTALAFTESSEATIFAGLFHRL